VITSGTPTERLGAQGKSMRHVHDQPPRRRGGTSTIPRIRHALGGCAALATPAMSRANEPDTANVTVADGAVLNEWNLIALQVRPARSSCAEKGVPT